MGGMSAARSAMRILGEEPTEQGLNWGFKTNQPQSSGSVWFGHAYACRKRWYGNSNSTTLDLRRLRLLAGGLAAGGHGRPRLAAAAAAAGLGLGLGLELKLGRLHGASWTPNEV